MRKSSLLWALGVAAIAACSGAGVSSSGGSAGSGDGGAGAGDSPGAGGKAGKGGSAGKSAASGAGGEGGDGQGGMITDAGVGASAGAGGTDVLGGGQFGGSGPGGGSIVGGAGGSMPVEDACAAVAQQASQKVLPADIIWAIDTSGSMSEESDFVQNKLGAFAGGIFSLGIDVHVALIAEPQAPPICILGICIPNDGICIPAPLGSGQCPKDTNPPFFLHDTSTVASTDALNVLLKSYSNWKQVLRPEATKTIIVVTDDDATSAPYAKSGFPDGAKGAAKKFIDDFTALDPVMLKGWKMNSIFSFTNCPSAATPGETWAELVSQTNGVKGDLCTQDFQPIFNDMAKAIVAGAKPLDCHWSIPPAPVGQELNASKVNVKYTSGTGQEQDIYYVDGQSKCDPQKGGWYFDDPVTPTQVVVCPTSCNTIQGDKDGKIDLLFGCERVALDPKLRPRPARGAGRRQAPRGPRPGDRRARGEQGEAMASGNSKATVFAAVGDVHGRMHAMVRLVRQREAKARRRASFVLQVGDFEPHRDEADVATMDAPQRYRNLGEFPEYHRGKAAFPWPVYFIGGNHEPHRLLEPLASGGEVAPSCSYLGRVGLTEAGGLRVLGLSGIYRESALPIPRPGRFDPAFSAYPYFNERDVDAALEARSVDVLMLHEWPSGLVGDVDEARLRGLRRFPSAAEVGNDLARLLCDHLAPRLVLCGHMHIPFRAELQAAPSSPRPGAPVPVACLASVDVAEGAAALFERRDDGTIVELA
jgi:lariat debranching enzyme